MEGVVMKSWVNSFLDVSWLDETAISGENLLMH